MVRVLEHYGIWHWPYFDCAKAVKLAERLGADHPQYAEDALWTRIYCYRIKGLDGNEYPYNDHFKD